MTIIKVKTEYGELDYKKTRLESFIEELAEHLKLRLSDIKFVIGEKEYLQNRVERTINPEDEFEKQESETIQQGHRREIYFERETSGAAASLTYKKIIGNVQRELEIYDQLEDMKLCTKDYLRGIAPLLYQARASIQNAAIMIGNRIVEVNIDDEIRLIIPRNEDIVKSLERSCDGYRYSNSEISFGKRGSSTADFLKNIEESFKFLRDYYRVEK